LIVENLSPTGCQELKTERISCIKGIDQWPFWSTYPKYT
jgi:hypothetical protein